MKAKIEITAEQFEFVKSIAKHFHCYTDGDWIVTQWYGNNVKPSEAWYNRETKERVYKQFP